MFDWAKSYASFGSSDRNESKTDNVSKFIQKISKFLIFCDERSAKSLPNKWAVNVLYVYASFVLKFIPFNIHFIVPIHEYWS